MLISVRCLKPGWVEVLKLAHVKGSWTHTTSMPFSKATSSIVMWQGELLPTFAQHTRSSLLCRLDCGCL